LNPVARREIPVAIAALVLWVLTAAAGLGLLMAGGAAKRAAAPQAAPVPAPPVRVPPIPRVKVHATPGEHPLLEFSHPLLGLVGLGFWFVYVGTRHAPLAWASFGVLVAAIAAGLSWLARNTLAARRGDRPARAGFPPRLVLLHGFTASATFVLAVLTALIASHV
jgi:hypothetical protein